MSTPPSDSAGAQRRGDVAFSSQDRLLVVAPHPDDESLATGGILQAALAGRAEARILFLTDGENNPWAQRATELRLRLTPDDQRRFGEIRRHEVATALASLGLGPESARFAGLPDQGLTNLLLDAPRRLVDPIVDEVARFQPTVIAAPSATDLHPDHSAAAVAVDLALRRVAGDVRARLAYVIHQPVAKGVTTPPAVSITLNADQRRRKHEAILAHRTQHRLRGPWLVSFAKSEEGFVDDASRIAHPITSVTLDERELVVQVNSRNYPRALGRRGIALVVDRWPVDEILGGAVWLPRSAGEATHAHPHASALLENTRWEGQRGRGRVVVIGTALDQATALYVKIIRRIGFFDEAGWQRIRP